MSTISEYYNYFKHQAENHVDLQHQDTAGDRVFAVINVEEALGDFRSGAQHQGFIFRLINYTYRPSQPADDHQAVKEIQGGFIVARFFNINAAGSQDLLDAMDESEVVMDDVIRKMIADSINGHPLFGNYFDGQQDIDVQPVSRTGDGSYAGWMCIFRTKQFFGNCLETADPAKWNDGGVTPIA